MRRSSIVLSTVILVGLLSPVAACRDESEQIAEPTVSPGYVATSVVESLSAAATYRASREEGLATETPIPSPTATDIPPTSTPTTAPSATPTIEPQPATATVTADGLRVRNGPGVAYAINGMVYEGDELQVEARTSAGDWLQISDDTGLTGWVYSEFVELAGDPGTVPVASTLPPTPQPTTDGGG